MRRRAIFRGRRREAPGAPLAADTPIVALTASAFTVPTDRPESDGTLAWNTTTLGFAEAEAGGLRGIGYTYAAAAARALIDDFPAVIGLDAMNTGLAWTRMAQSVRNVGRPGIASCAIAAVDTAAPIFLSCNPLSMRAALRLSRVLLERRR